MLSSSASEPGAYANMLQGSRRIWREDGVRGFWRGFTPGLFGIVQTAVQFALYDTMKSRARQRTDSEITTSEFILFSGSSKLISTILTYPYQVVRSRMQIYKSKDVYGSPVDVIIKVYTHEGGVSGFYKGMTANLLRVVPATCITLVVYETVKSHYA